MLKIILCISLSCLAIYYVKTNTYYNGPISDHFDGHKFYDPKNAYTNNFFDFLKWQLTQQKSPWPNKVELKQTDTPPKMVDKIRISYVGHVSFLIQTEGVNILTDPVWSKRASPFSFIGPKRVIKPGINFKDLPKIDVILISHNHYDHLDLKTIQQLWYKFKPKIIVPLGNDTIIKNFDSNIEVRAYDWGDNIKINKNLAINLEPMQHWSARGMFDKNHALWAAYVIASKNNGNIYFIGDSGYSSYFKEALVKYKEFKLALLPIGAYQPRWFMKYAHMDPEDAIQASKDLGLPYTIPSHYDVFSLADEPYNDALNKLLGALKSTKHNFHVVKVGSHIEL